VLLLCRINPISNYSTLTKNLQEVFKENKQLFAKIIVIELENRTKKMKNFSPTKEVTIVVDVPKGMQGG